MTVLATVRFPLVAERLAQRLAAGADLQVELATRALQNGGLRHRLVTGPTHSMILIEWESRDGLERFLESDEVWLELVDRARLDAPPEVEFWEPLIERTPLLAPWDGPLPGR